MRVFAYFSPVEVELLWPLVQELIQERDIASDDLSFLEQNAEVLGCPPRVLQALIEVRLASLASEPIARLRALTALIQALNSEASRKLPFLLEVTQFLGLPVDLVQVLLQVPRSPALRFLMRLLRAVEAVPDSAAYRSWLEEMAQQLQLSREALAYLTQLQQSISQKSLALALASYWELLKLLEAQKASAVELAYLMEVAREARIADPIAQGLQEYWRLRGRTQSPIEALAYLVRTFSRKGVLSEEELPFIAHVAAEEGVSEPVLEALLQLEAALMRHSVGFGAEALEPLIRALLEANLLDKAKNLLIQRAQELGLTIPQLEAILELERLLFEKKAKFPQHIQPLIRSFVENARIEDSKLLYLVKKVQELGGSEKVLRSLIQIEITAQRKAAEKVILQPPPPPEPVSVEPPPPATPSVSSSPSLGTGSSLGSSALSSSELQGLTIKTAEFPKGGNFPEIGVDFSSLKVLTLKSEKDRIRKCEIFPKGGRAQWYAVVEYGSGELVVILRGKPEHRLEEVLQIAASPTGDALAIKLRAPGGQRVYFNGDESVVYDEVGSFVFSPNGKHLAYIALKGQDYFATLDNGALRPYAQIQELTFRPGTEMELYYAAQIEKNKWVILDNISRVHSEPYPALGALTFSKAGDRLAYAFLKGRKFHVFDGQAAGEGFDRVGDIAFSPDGRHLVYSGNKGSTISLLWDHKPLCTAEGIMNITLSPDSRFVAYVAREKDGHVVYAHNKRLSMHEKVDKLFVTSQPPNVIYAVEQGGKHHIFINGAPESGPYEHISLFSGKENSYAAIVRKSKDQIAVVHNGRLSPIYTNIPMLVWDETGKQLAYPARKRPTWSGVVWNETESDHYEYPQHLTFGGGGRALLFFARRRDGWYAVLNDRPIPDSLCAEILTPPAYDEKSKAFYYLYRQGKDVYEGKILLQL